MRSDWLRFVSPKAIVERELPCGDNLAETILRDEVVNLLSPEPKLPLNGQKGDSPLRARDSPPRKRARTENHGNPPTFPSFDSTTTTTTEVLDVPVNAGDLLPPSDGASMTQGVSRSMGDVVV